MVIMSDDVTITIDGTDYSTDINEYNETGGDKIYVTKKMFGNTYKKIVTGRSNYEVSFNFKIEDTTLNTLYESTGPITITISGTGFTVTYYNMLPNKLEIISQVDDFIQGKITYSAAAYDKNNTRYNRVLT